jgi:hypothetical protein
MNEYAFDIRLTAAVRVKASSEKEAREMLRLIDCNEANLGSWPNGDPIMAEVSMDETVPHLYELNGAGLS